MDLSQTTGKPHHVRLGLALSGGASRGVAHIGVLKAFSEQNIPISVLSGTSVGALVAAFHAFGVSLDDMYQEAAEMSWMSISSFSPTRSALLSNRVIGEIIEKHIGKVNIEDAPVPLAIITTDISSGEKVVLRRGSLSQAVMASASLPGIFKPVEIEGRLLMDGFLVENVPLSPLRAMGADIVVGVSLSTLREYREPSGIINILMNAFEIAVDENVRLLMDKADLMITPELSDIVSEDDEWARDFFDSGYAAGLRNVPAILKLISQKKAVPKVSIWQKIRKLFLPAKKAQLGGP